MANFVTDNYKLDVTPQGSYPVVYMSQFEDGRQIRFRIVNKGISYTIPVGVSAFISGLKSNGGYYEHTCEIDTTRKYITVPVEADMTDVNGRGVANITLTNGDGEKVISAKFIINVQEGISDDGIEIPTEAETVFRQLLDEIRAEAAKLDLDMDALDANIEEFKSDVSADIIDFKSDVSDDIDAIDGRMDTFIASHSGIFIGSTSITETTLWSGTAGNNDILEINLPDFGASYDYIDVYVKTGASSIEIKRTKPNVIYSDSGFTFSAVNLNDMQYDSSLPIGVYEFLLNGGSPSQAAPGTEGWIQLYITFWRWSGLSTANSVQEESTSANYKIVKLVGVKYRQVEVGKDSELTDIRVGADGKTYQTAGASVRGQISDLNGEIDGLKEGLTHGVLNDVIIVNQLEDGYYSVNNGQKYPNSSTTSYRRSVNLIRVEEKALYYSNVSCEICCFNESGVFLGSIYIDTKATKSRRKMTLPGTVWAGIYATGATKFELYKVDSSEVRAVEYPYAGNDYIYIQQCWCNGTGGVANTANFDMLILGNVKEGDRYYVSNEAAYNCLCFDEVGTLIAAQVETRSPAGKIYTVPEGARQMYVNFYNKRTKGVNNEMSDYLCKVDMGKILAIGDSLTWLDGRQNYGGMTYFSGWQRQLRLAGYDVVSAGFSGYPYATGLDIVDGVDYSIYKEIVTNAYSVSGYNMVILFGGTNDVLYNGALGDRPTEYSNRTFDASKFNGALGAIISYIRTNNATALILLASFPKSEAVTRSYANAKLRVSEIEYNANFWSCKYVDVWSDLNIQPTYDGFDQFFYDATHPNFLGMERIGKIMLEAANSAVEAANSAAAASAANSAAAAANSATEASDSATAAANSATDAATTAQDISEHLDQIDANTEGIEALKEDLSTLNTEGMVPTSEQMLSDNYTEDSVPYHFRKTVSDNADREELEIVGGSVAWNQLVQNNMKTYVNSVADTRDYLQLRFVVAGSSTFRTLENVYSASVVEKIIEAPATGNGLIRHNGSSQDLNLANQIPTIEGHKLFIHIKVTSADPATVSGVSTDEQMCIDLTAMFGSTIADYVYGLETATAGAGVAWLKSHFPRIFDAGYIPYNAGTFEHVSGLSAHKMTGFNQWDEEWEVGAYNSSSGEKTDGVTDRIRSKNFIPVLPSTTYYKNKGLQVYWYDADHNFIGWNSMNNPGTLTTPSNCHYMTFNGTANSGSTYNHDICINLHWDGERDGEYEPYEEHSYPLDSDVVLRGIPKLDANNNLYYDGDEYEADGTVTRRYGIVDLGTLTWAATSAYGNVYRSDANLPDAVSGIRSIGQQAPIILSTSAFKNSYDVTDAAQVATAGLIGINYNKVYVTFAESMTAAQIKTALSGVYMLYTLKNKYITTESADPYTEIQNVSNWGTEEFVTDALVPVGHNTKYPDNMRMKLDNLPWNFASLIAPTESGFKATRNYTTGALLIVNNVLYKATANIANGGTITVGTNVTATTLAEVISALS